MDTAAALGYFQAPAPELATDPALEQLVEGGYALLGYYEATTDTAVNDAVVGALVDAAMALSLLDTGALPAAACDRAAHLTAALEDLVNAIAAAVERNIAAQR